MSLEKIHLRKLLQFFFLPENKLISKLRADIRNDLKTSEGNSSDGGDFFTPFWSDIKKHVAGDADLTDQTTERIASNKNRRRLYPLLYDGFNRWWNEKRRWTNQTFVIFEKHPYGSFEFKELDAIVKVENILALEIEDHTNRIIYPYFSEEPTLSSNAARLGLWLMGNAINDYPVEDMRILDVIRGTSFSTLDCPLNGNEEHEFFHHYKNLISKWDTLKGDYQ